MSLINIERKPAQWTLRNRITYDFGIQIQSPTSMSIPDSAIFIDNTDITISFFIRPISGTEAIFKKTGVAILTISELGLQPNLTYHVVVNADTTVYINSELQVLTKSLDWTAAADIIFGIFSGTDPATYDISNILFFNKTISAAEVYNIFSAGGSFDSSLHEFVIAYYPLNGTVVTATDLNGQYYAFDTVEQFNYAKVTAQEANHATFRTVTLSASVLAMTNQSVQFVTTGLGYIFDTVTGINGGPEGNYDINVDPFDTTFGVYDVGDQVFLDFISDNNNDLTYLQISDNFVFQQTTFDISQLNQLTFFEIYGTSGELNTITFPRTLPSDSFSTQIRVRGTTLEGTLDLSPLETLGTNLYVSDVSISSSRKITDVKFPASSKDLDGVYFDGALLSGTLDLSSLSLGRTIEVCSSTPNPLINEIILPSVFTQTLTSFDATGSSITELDLSSVDFSGTLTLTSCLLLKDLYLPTSLITSGAIAILNCNYTPITGILDLSNLELWGGSNYFAYCINLKGFKFPNTVQNLGYFQIQNTNVEGVLDMTNVADAGLYTFSLTRITDIQFATNATSSTLIASRASLIGTVDLTPITALRSDINLAYNKDLTEVLLDNTDNVANYNTNITLHYCNLTGTLDLTNIVKLFTVQTYNNPNLTSIIYGTDTRSMNLYSAFNLYNCDLTGTIDMSNLTDLPKSVYTYYNPNLTGLLFPSSTTNSVELLNFRECNLQGTLDLSGINTLGDIGNACSLTIYNNLQLEYITFPSSGKEVKTMSLYNNNLKDLNNLTGFSKLMHWNSAIFDVRWNPMSATVLQQILDDLDVLVPTGFTSRNIRIYNQILTQTEIDNLKLSASYINLRDVKNITMDLESY